MSGYMKFEPTQPSQTFTEVPAQQIREDAQKMQAVRRQWDKEDNVKGGGS